VVPDVSTVAAFFMCGGRQSSGRAVQCHIREDSDLQLSFCSSLMIGTEPVVEITLPAAACWFAVYRNEYNGYEGRSEVKGGPTIKLITFSVHSGG
jgi:hypothetical protein